MKTSNRHQNLHLLVPLHIANQNKHILGNSKFLSFQTRAFRANEPSRASIFFSQIHYLCHFKTTVWQTFTRQIRVCEERNVLCCKFWNRDCQHFWQLMLLHRSYMSQLHFVNTSFPTLVFTRKMHLRSC